MKSLFVGCIALLLCLNANAQYDSVRIVSDKVFKFSPMQLVMGEINFSAEFSINKNSSIEFELGPTISRIGFGTAATHYGSTIDYYGPQSERNSAIGMHASVGYRFYPLEDEIAPYGFYLSPIIKYRRYSYLYEDYSGKLGDAKGFKDQFMFRFNTGYQFWPTDHFSIDVYFGVGLGMRTDLEKYITYNYSDPNDPNSTGTYSWATSKGTGARLNSTIGVKFGLGAD